MSFDVKTRLQPADLQEPDSTAPFDDETTRPVPLQLIARLAAQDPAVELKIGVVDIPDAAPADEKQKAG